jgi:hypothetical protein
MSDLTAALKTMCLPYIVVAAARLLVRAAVAETLTSQQQLLAVTSRIEQRINTELCTAMNRIRSTMLRNAPESVRVL